MSQNKKNKQLKARKNRIRNKVRGTSIRPRVTVYLSNKNIFAQVIDDDAGKTIVSASTLDKGAGAKGNNKAAARWVGEALSVKAIKSGIKAVVFDRNGRKYHGKVKELADTLREKGLSL